MSSLKDNKTCTILEQYLSYLTVIKGRSQLTAIEYRIDVLMLFSFIKEKRGFDEEEIKQRDFSDVNIDFIKTITVTDMYDFITYCSKVRKITVATRSRKKETLQIIGKGNKERRIFLTPAIKKAINTWLEVRKTMNPQTNALFITKQGTRVTSRGVQDIVKEYLKKAGLSDRGFSTHKLRHSAATILHRYGHVDVRTLQVLLAPITGLLLLIAFIVYIITSPFGFLTQWLVGDEIKAVDDFQKDYGYTQEIGIYDSDYAESLGESYEGIIFANGETQVIYYNQLDERWADKPYGTTGTIGSSGCGPTSMAIVISTLTKQNIDPVQMSEWSYKNGYRCEGNGSYHSLIPESAKAFGLNVESISQDNPQKLIDALSGGKLVVAIMAKGYFTRKGHFIVLRGVTSEGKILVADPASQNRSKIEWDIDIIINEARKGASAGGAFWAIY